MRRFTFLLLLLLPALANANPPTASYIFPAGAQRGTKVNVRVGGLFLHKKCGFEMLGPGIAAPSFLTRTKTTWFEGPILPLPDSQRVEDYPKDMAGRLTIAADAPLGVRYWRVWTSQGATGSMKFVVGALPEIIEEEIDGEPIPVNVKLPVTINGRIFPREDIDIYSFNARKGETIRCEVHAARLGSPLDARLEIRDAQGKRLAEAAAPTGGDPVIAFNPPADGEYQIRIHDSNMQGGQAFVYRLTLGAEPFVDRVFPLGGRRGSTVDLEITGQGVPTKATVAIPKDAPADFPFPFSVRSKPTNAVLLDVDDHPEFLAPADLSNIIPLPAILNGRIQKPGQIDEWKWQGKKGEAWDFELRAARLGSKLDGVLTILGDDGKPRLAAELAPRGASPAAKPGENHQDPSVRFTVPADGAYRVQVQDRFRSRGGPEFGYRLRIAGPSKVEDFRLTIQPSNARPRPTDTPGGDDAITLLRKGTAKLKITAVRQGGHAENIALEIDGLPKGVTFTPTTIQSYATAVDLTFKADEAARIDASRLTIVGRAKVNGNAVERTARFPAPRGLPEQTSVLLSVALPTPFVIKGEYDMGFAARGGMHKRKYKIERNGFEGPIEISLADKQARHLQGVEGPTIIVPGGFSEFTYAAYLPPWMETGRTCRVCVMGVGVIREPDGSEHAVSYSSVNTNEQLIAVIGPGMLAMEAERTSFRAEPGKSFTISVKVQRGQGVEGPVELELLAPAHLHGLTAMKATIAAKETRGQLVVTCGEKLAGPFNMPIVVRATLRQNGEPIVAEVKLDVQP